MRENRDVIIRMVLDTFDTIDQLKYDNNVLRARVRAYERNTQEATETFGAMDEQVLAYGRKEVVDKTLKYWRVVGHDVDEDGTITYQPYESWCDDVVDRSKIPTWCSVDAFFDYFDVEIRAVYEDERKKAAAKAEEG